MTSTHLRDILAQRALAVMPRVFTLQDRTPLSATYGCFDRDYWHTRVMDFPCGMDQELAYPLALAWSLDLPGNIYFGKEPVRAWAEAGIRYAARSAHKDGSCDDYYPFERAAGAAVFSLLACLDASETIGVTQDDEINAFFRKRGHWLGTHKESGRLSNHEAMIVACLARLAERFPGEEWEGLLQERVQRLLSWRNAEGWFDEYGGADPSYLTLTIAQLADIDRRRPDLALREPCEAAIRFIASVMHPDGSLGGEYTSRATASYFSHGFEIAGAWMPEALALNEKGLRPLADNRSLAWDDRLFGHTLASWLVTWREWREDRPEALAPAPEGRTDFPAAKIMVDRAGEGSLHLSYGRGGIFRYYEQDKLALADTGPALALTDGRIAVCHFAGASEATVTADRIEIQGTLAFAKTSRLSPIKSIVLRAIMVTVGRLFPDTIRRLLQRMLVTGRSDAPFAFRRTLTRQDGRWTVRDEIKATRGWANVKAAGIGGFQTSLTTVMSRIWQPDELQPWLDLTERLAGLDASAPLVAERPLAAVQQ